MIANDLAQPRVVVNKIRKNWKPPAKLTLSEWADLHYYLSAGDASPGRWKTLPYQKGIMDAMTDPKVERVSIMKSARVGYSKMIDAFVGYSMDQDPCRILVVQPTVDAAKSYSKEDIAPMLRDCPRLAAIRVEDQEASSAKKNSTDTMLHKVFPGGILSLVGANSGTGLRSVSRKRVLFDEVDAYPPSAGSDGDPISLGIARTRSYWDRKIVTGSTPLVAGASRIEALFLEGDQRRYFVPCPSCGHMDVLSFREQAGIGHFMRWPEGKPEDAFFVCRKNGCVIEHSSKRDMIDAGEWRASEAFRGHASFHIWAAYSTMANTSWGDIAKEFLDKKDNTELLRVFVNTWLGETWVERGEAPEWERLYARRETYRVGTVPNGVEFLTCGVDVQKDRFVWEVVGWAMNKESWSIAAGVIVADTSDEKDWTKLDELIETTFANEAGINYAIKLTAVDSGFNTQMVYHYARQRFGRVIAVKGVTTERGIIGAPQPVDVTVRGRRYARGCKVWPVGVDNAKSEFYGWLRLEIPEDGVSFPMGYCHFPEHGKSYFQQLTAEHRVAESKKTGHVVYVWKVLPNRENHWLDARVYARAGASQLGLDMFARQRHTSKPVAEETPAPTPAPAVMPVIVTQAPPASQPTVSYSNFLGGRGTNWNRR